MAIEPDNKNWTWVLERPCPDCAYDASAVVLRDIGMSIRDIASQWEVILLHPGATKRPVENVWSPSEYGCHVRDVMRMADFRLELMTTEDDPMFTNWNQDETAVAERYGLAFGVGSQRIALERPERAAGFAAEHWQQRGERS